MTVMPGKTPRPSGDWPMPAITRLCPASLLMSLPSKVTVPDVSGRRPEMVFRVVVFPAPFAPMRVTISPSSTSSEMPLIASILP